MDEPKRDVSAGSDTPTQPSAANTNLEQRKLALEEKKFDFEMRARDRAFAIQERELQAKIDEAKRSRLTNPLSLAIIGAFIAGLASITAQFVTGHNQIVSDQKKHGQEMETEKFKAEAGRILEAIRPGDPDKAACNLSFFLGLGLVESPDMRMKLGWWLANRKGGSGPSTATVTGSAAQTGGLQVPAFNSFTPDFQQACELIPVGSTPATPPQTTGATPDSGKEGAGDAHAPPVQSFVETFSSDWMGGGHTQNETCDRGTAELQRKYPGKRIIRLDSSEESRKDFFNHVEYRYYCRFTVSS